MQESDYCIVHGPCALCGELDFLQLFFYLFFDSFDSSTVTYFISPSEHLFLSSCLIIVDLLLFNHAPHGSRGIFGPRATETPISAGDLLSHSTLLLSLLASSV